MPDNTRRDFVKKLSLAGGLLSVTSTDIFTLFSPSEGDDLQVNIFSKHLQFLDYTSMAQKAKELGFDGVDLTVRPNGHVSPEKVGQDLPRAVKAIRQQGLNHHLMTTAIEDADNKLDEKVLQAAAKSGIKIYRMNWYKYAEKGNMPDQLKELQQRIGRLSRLNKELGLTGCYQNHSGSLVGSSLWEIYEILKLANIENFGVQFDIRHAVVEGGLSWPNALRLIHSQIKSLVLKDFKWEKENGEWKVINTPIGEGMVDFKTYFGLLKQYNINVPVSLHLEYPLGGAEHGKKDLTCDPGIVYEAMENDLKIIRKLWKDA